MKFQKRLKRIALLTLCLILALLVFGCGSAAENQNETQNAENQNSAETTSAVAEVKDMQTVVKSNEIQNVEAEKGNVQ